MKLIYDTIHDSINIESSDLQFIDNRWMKRLKRIKQLGLSTTYFHLHHIQDLSTY